MAFLNHIFSSVKSIAEEEIVQEGEILEKWEDYTKTIADKKEIISKLPYSFGSQRNSLKRLRHLLTLEIADLRGARKEEHELIRCLEALEHGKRKIQFERLESRLGYIQSYDEYIYRLLGHLYVILKREWQAVGKLERCDELRKYRKLVSILTSELEMERAALNQMYDVDKFHDIFEALVKREKAALMMDAKEEKLLSLMQRKLYTEEIASGVTAQWARAVFASVREEVKKAYDQGILDGHPDQDFQFVNGPEFIDLARRVIFSIRKREVSEKTLKVFVYLFREWFNWIQVK